MVYGFGRGPSGRRGMGCGFRGTSPPWPYVGRGRGGLPRCSYPGLWTETPYPAYGGPRRESYVSPPGPEQEMELLKGQAEAMKRELDRVEARIRNL